MRTILGVVATLCLPILAWGQAMPAPESIRAEAPPVPRSLVEALNRYQNIRSASFEGWDGAQDRAMYITTRFGDTPQVHHVASPGAARRQLTFFPERVRSVQVRPRHDQFLSPRPGN